MMHIIARVTDINIDEETASGNVAYLVKYIASDGSFSSSVTVSTGILTSDSAISKAIRDAVAADAAEKCKSTVPGKHVILLGAPARIPMEAEGTVSLIATKTAQVNYKDNFGNPISFQSAPRLSLTILGASTVVPYRSADIKTGGLYTGFVIGFQSKVTLDVEWHAVERI